MYEEYFEKELLTVDETMEILYLGKNTVYELLRSGELKGIKFGKIWRVPKDSIREMITKKMEQKYESDKTLKNID